jgi:hypothetical protein
MSEQVQRIRVGDLFRIDLPDGRFAFGCVLRDAAVGIYPGTYPRSEFPVDLEKVYYAFATGIYSDILPSGVCPVIGHREFASVDDEWPPPTCMLGGQGGQPAIYYKGRIVPCKPEDVVGLELTQVYELEHIIQRILNTQPELEQDCFRGRS